jgi:hypothetical protein
MNKRRMIVAVVFVALCLSLSGLLLRRQITAHPKPPKMDILSTKPDPNVWHVATGAVTKAVTGSIQAQLTAIRTGDATKAIFYQSSGLRRHFATPQQFVQNITHYYPEFGHSRSAEFGPVWVDKTGNYAEVVVTSRGENGQRARGYYLMIQEDGIFRVAGVGGGAAIR